MRSLYSKLIIDIFKNFLCVGGCVHPGVCSHADGCQSGKQVRQSRTVRHLCHTKQRLCLGLSHRWGPAQTTCVVLKFLLRSCLSLVDALYRSTYPEYLQYIYLVAPVSLMLLNPIGFALCEVQRWRRRTDAHVERSTARVLGVVTLQVLHHCRSWSMPNPQKNP